MRSILFLTILVTTTILKGQTTLSTEILGMRSGISALLSFDTPIRKSEKFHFSQMGQLGIDYQMENPFVFLMPSVAYGWKPTLKSTLGAIYMGGDCIVPSLGFQAISFKKNRLLLFYPIVTIESNPQVWMIYAGQVNKELKNEKKGILGLSALQLFAGGGHELTVGIFHLGLEKKKFQYGFASFLMFFGKNFDFVYDPGLFLNYRFR